MGNFVPVVDGNRVHRQGVSFLLYISKDLERQCQGLFWPKALLGDLFFFQQSVSYTLSLLLSLPSSSSAIF